MYATPGHPLTDAEESRNKLVTDNIGLVGLAVGLMSRSKAFAMIGEEEAQSIGREAIIIAAQNYRPEDGKFSTYAVTCIKLSILTAANRSRVIAIPKHLLSKVVPKDRLQAMSYRKYRAAALLMLRVDTLSPTPQRPHGIDVEDEPDTIMVDDLELSKPLATALNHLLPRRRAVLTMRVIDGLTLKETAAALGICKERVRQIQLDALADVRKEMEGAVR